MPTAEYRPSLPRLLPSMGFGAARCALSDGLHEIYMRRPPSSGRRSEVQIRLQHTHPHIDPSTFFSRLETLLTLYSSTFPILSHCAFRSAENIRLRSPHTETMRAMIHTARAP